MIIIDNLFTVDLVQLVHAACQIPSQNLLYLIKFTLKFGMYKFLTSVFVFVDFSTVYIYISDETHIHIN